MTRVVHCKRDPYDVYIGRPSKYGNPYSHTPGTSAEFLVASREEAITMYRLWVEQHPELLADMLQLQGKTLGCWCAPKQCHGDVIIEIINRNTGG